MYKLETDKKFTIILSAYQSDFNTPIQDLINTELMKVYLEHDLHVHAIRAVGVYHGACEQ